MTGKRTFYPPPPPTDFLKSFERTTSVDLKDHLADRDYIPHKDPLTDRTNSLHDNEFANRLKAKRTTSARVIVYSLTDLQTATANFATGRLLGEGTFGRVYRAKYPDGKVCFWLVMLLEFLYPFFLKYRLSCGSLHLYNICSC